MRILVNSPYFFPRVGGLESVVLTLCLEWTRLGHAVRVHTESASETPDNFPFEVSRNPAPREMLSAMRWCDVFHQPGLSLRNMWPMLVRPRPWVVAHHIWYERSAGHTAWQDHLKQALALGAVNISVSNAMARHIRAKSVVLGNPYRQDLFCRKPDIPKDRDVVFLGRLIAEKGAHVLLDALAQLKRSGVTLTATVVGRGPEEQALRNKVRELRLEQQVTLAGSVTGEDLVTLLNRHKVMAIPSLWEEPFGVVALEGAACGCALVAFSTGGLPDAVGPCGVLVPKDDRDGFAQALRSLVEDPKKRDALLAHAPGHLALHTPEAVARRYLDVFENARNNWHGGRAS